MHNSGILANRHKNCRCINMENNKIEAWKKIKIKATKILSHRTKNTVVAYISHRRNVIDEQRKKHDQSWSGGVRWQCNESRGRQAFGEGIGQHFVRALRHEFEESSQDEFTHIVLTKINKMGELSVHWIFAHRNTRKVDLVQKSGLKIEFLLKTDGGYPRDAGIFFHSRWQTLGVPSALTPIGQLHQSPPSPVPGPGDLGRCPSHQSYETRT